METYLFWAIAVWTDTRESDILECGSATRNVKVKPEYELETCFSLNFYFEKLLPWVPGSRYIMVRVIIIITFYFHGIDLTQFFMHQELPNKRDLFIKMYKSEFYYFYGRSMVWYGILFVRQTVKVCTAKNCTVNHTLQWRL